MSGKNICYLDIPLSFNSAMTYDDCRVTSNQKGYSREDGTTGFDPNCLISLSCISISFWLAVARKNLQQAKAIHTEHKVI